MRILLSIALFVATAFPAILVGQNPGSYSFNEQYGWDVETVYDILEDSEGMFWFGTSEGLFRFDGQEFYNYSLLGYQQEYSSLKIDPEGRIWFKNFTGQLFYLQDDSVHLFMEEEDYHTSSDYSVSLFPKVLTTSSSSIKSHDFYKDTTILLHQGTSYKLSTNPTNRAVFSFIDRPDNLRKQGKYMLYVAEINGTGIDTLANVVVLSSDQLALSVSGDNVILLQRQKDKSILWQIVDDTIHSVDTIAGLGLLDIQEVCLPSNHVLAICTRRGYFSRNLNAFHPPQKLLFPELSVSNVKQDRAGNTWIGSTNKGIYILPNQEISSFQLPSRELLFACSDTTGTAWLTDFEGQVFELNSQTGDARLLAEEPNAIGRPFYDCFQNELLLSSPKKKVKLPAGLVEPAGGIGHAKDVLFLAEGIRVVISSEIAMIQWDLSKADSTQLPWGLKPEEFIPYVDGFHIRTLRNKRGSNAVLDNDHGNLFINFADGLYTFTQAKGEPVLHDGQKFQVTALLPDHSAGLWAASNRNKLMRVHGTHVKEKLDLDVTAKQLLQWKGFLFIVDKTGVLKYDTLSGNTSRIDYRDGLSAEYIVHGLVYKDTLRLLTKNELYKIPCEFDGRNTNVPKGWIKSVSLFDKHLPLDTTFDLSHFENNFTIQFGAMALKSRNSYTFNYRMLGVSDDWIENSSTESFARFPKLLPGDYTFEMKVCNEDLVCSQVQAIRFVIRAPYYQRWWFYLLLIVLSSLTIGLLIRWRTKGTREREKLLLEQVTLKKEISQAKIASLRAQMNPHFMFNALNSIQEFIVTNQKDIASEYLADFADLMRRYLNQSQYEEVSLREEIETLELYLRLEELRFEHELTCKVECAPELDIDSEKIPVMLLQPFIENSIKHGLLQKRKPKHLKIWFDRTENGFSCTITDNGVGRRKSQEINLSRKHHQSFATSAIEQRLELLNAAKTRPIEAITTDLFDAKGEPAGTMVLLKVPND